MIKYQCGNPEYMAPELLKNDFYWNKVDIWSFGVIVYYLVCSIDRQKLIPSSFYNGLSGETLNYLNPIINQVSFIPLPDFPISNNLLDFISQCLLLDPKFRLSVDHALNHPFINNSSP